MRIAAGILMIIVGFVSTSTRTWLSQIFAEDFFKIVGDLSLLTLVIGIVGGICAFRRRHKLIVLIGAIWVMCSSIVYSSFYLIVAITMFLKKASINRASINYVDYFGVSLGIIFILMGVLAFIFIKARLHEFNS